MAGLQGLLTASRLARKRLNLRQILTFGPSTRGFAYGRYAFITAVILHAYCCIALINSIIPESSMKILDGLKDGNHSQAFHIRYTPGTRKATGPEARHDRHVSLSTKSRGPNPRVTHC